MRNLAALAAGLAVGAGGALAVAFALDLGQGATPSASTVAVEVPVEGSPAGFDATAIYRSRAPGTVSVVAYRGGAVASGGAGFVVDDEGTVITAAHVVTTSADVDSASGVEAYPTLYVQSADYSRAPARLVGYDLFSDVAVLRVERGALPRLPALPLGRSPAVQVGDRVAAIGTPYGRPGSLSAGVVSQIGQPIDAAAAVCFDTRGALQTDAAINQGNSGGPLLDARGRVIGMVTQIDSPDGTDAGVAYAVPVDIVRRALAQIRRDGRVRYAWLGVAADPVTSALVERFSLPARQGALLRSIAADGPAARAGLRTGRSDVLAGQTVYPRSDLIVRIAGQPVRGVDDLVTALFARRAGERIEVRYWRDGRQRTATVQLGERPLSPAGGCRSLGAR